MSEIVIIITRIDEGNATDNEWQGLWEFAENEHCICMCADTHGQWEKRNIDLNNGTQTISQEVKAIIFNGASCRELFNKFDNLISKINSSNERDILMAIHTGGNASVSEIAILRRLNGFNYGEAIIYSSPEYDGEIKNLADAINNTTGDKEAAFSALKMWIKKKTHASPHLIALSILCQGFLVVCSESEERDRYWNDIKPALKEMGWIDENGHRVIDNDNSLIKQNLKAKWEKVQMSNWWYDEVFADGKNDSSIKWETLEKTIASECNVTNGNSVPAQILELFSGIRNDPNKIKPEKVANAYLKTSEVLKKVKA